MRVRVVSEGMLDTGDGIRLGAVGVLVKRLLSEKLGREVADWEIEGDRLPRTHERSQDVRGYERKVDLAIQAAAADGCSSVAIVVDRDRTAGRQRLDLLEAGRQLAVQRGDTLAERTAVGVAVETVEAWLLADERALNEALRLAPPTGSIQAPESLTGGPKTEHHPKEKLRALLERCRTEQKGSYEAVAEQVTLEQVELRCPVGFAPFAAEVRKRCG